LYNYIKLNIGARGAERLRKSWLLGLLLTLWTWCG